MSRIGPILVVIPFLDRPSNLESCHWQFAYDSTFDKSPKLQTEQIRMTSHPHKNPPSPIKKWVPPTCSNSRIPCPFVKKWSYRLSIVLYKVPIGVLFNSIQELRQEREIWKVVIRRLTELVDVDREIGSKSRFSKIHDINFFIYLRYNSQPF